MTHPNPTGICTWADEADCRGCTLRPLLGCRPDMRDFHLFVVSQLPNLGMAVIGLVLVGIITAAWCH